MDNGHLDIRLVADITATGVRTYVPERRKKSRIWTNKPEAYEEAFRANRRRVRANKGRQLNRWRSERCERTFAHVCETGGGRRSWLRGQTNVSKSHACKCAAFNLGLLLRKVWGLSKPRNSAEGAAALFFALFGACFMAAAIASTNVRRRVYCAWDRFRRMLVTRVTNSEIRFSKFHEKWSFLNGLLGIIRNLSSKVCSQSLQKRNNLGIAVVMASADVG